jgi:CheY-like chemotaxis protein
VPTVLVVEDEWVIAEVLAVTLADAGYHVITAANGQQALANLAETRPDVIVTDTMMPILDGPGLLAALAADPAHRDIPVIMMSALDEAAVAKLTQGYRAFLGKPFLGPELLRILERVLGEAAKGPPSRGADP